MGAGKTWTKEEIQFLIDNWHIKTDKEIAEILGRPEAGVADKRKRLKLHRSTRKYTFQDVVAEFAKTDYELISGPEDYYDAAQNTLKYICPRHRDKGVLTISLGHLQSGRGCYYCGREVTEAAHRIDLNDPKYKELCTAKGLIFQGTTRISGKINIGYICPNHKEEGIQYMTYHNMNRNRKDFIGCPLCHISKWEEGIRSILNKLGIKYESQKKFKDMIGQKPFKLDFFLPDVWKAIEYDGIHHYQPFCFNGLNLDIARQEYQETVKRDRMKNEYCRKHNIPLLRIPYYDYDIAEKLIKDFVF